MDVQIVARNIDNAGQFRQYAEEKLLAATDRFRDMALAATVRLEDETGPAKGGVDKVCHIEVKLRTGEVRIKEHGEEFFATIDVAVDRLKAALSREVARAKRGIAEG